MITLHLPAVEVWTVNDLGDLPSYLRYELHNGRLEIMSPAVAWHQRVEHRICAVLMRDGRWASTQVGVLNTSSDTRVADVGVFLAEPDARSAWHPAANLALVVEVWSPSSDDKDRNPHWYAERGIPEYWLAEPIEGDTWGALITQYQLARTPGGTVAYVETGQITLAALEANRPA